LTEKLLEFVFSGKIKAASFYPELSLITLGFKDGKVENFTLQVEPEGSSPSSFVLRSTNMNLLVTKSFRQVKGSCISEEERKIGASNDVQIESKREVQRYKLDFQRHSTLTNHKARVNDTKVDCERGLLFTAGNDKRLIVYDLETMA